MSEEVKLSEQAKKKDKENSQLSAYEAEMEKVRARINAAQKKRTSINKEWRKKRTHAMIELGSYLFALCGWKKENKDSQFDFADELDIQGFRDYARTHKKEIVRAMTKEGSKPYLEAQEYNNNSFVDSFNKLNELTKEANSSSSVTPTEQNEEETPQTQPAHSSETAQNYQK